MMKKGLINITGASESRVAPVMGKLLKEQTKGQCLVVVSSYIRAKRLATDLSFFTDKTIYLLPQEEESFIRYEAKNQDQMLQRLKILKAVCTGEDCIVIAPAGGAIRRLPPKNIFQESSFSLKTGEDIQLDQVKEQLIRMGYQRMSLVDAKGQFSLRGSILDIFTPDSDHPCRIELFDTEIDSIRTFHLDTQRSIENLTQISVYPAEQILKDEERFSQAAARIRQAYAGQIRKFSGDNLSREEQERGQNLRERCAQLAEFAENCVNLQHLEHYLHYFYDDTQYIWDYMQDPLILIDDPGRIYKVWKIGIRNGQRILKPSWNGGRQFLRIEKAFPTKTIT